MPNLLHTSIIMALANRLPSFHKCEPIQQLRQLNQLVCYLELDYCYSIVVVSGNFMSIEIELLLLVVLVLPLLLLTGVVSFHFISFHLACVHICVLARHRARSFRMIGADILLFLLLLLLLLLAWISTSAHKRASALTVCLCACVCARVLFFCLLINLFTSFDLQGFSLGKILMQTELEREK